MSIGNMGSALLCRRRFGVMAGALGISAMAARKSAAQAGAFPNQRFVIVVGYTAGGAADTIARLVSSYMYPQVGAIVENRPGAAGIVGAQHVANSAPDGYTLFQGHTGEMAINKYINPPTGFEADKALAAVAMLFYTPTTVAVVADSPYKTLEDLIADAKANPGKITFGSTGRGTQSHIAGEVMGKAIGAPLRHIAYPGYPQGIQDLLGGKIGSFWAAHPPSVPLLKDGKIRYLAVSGAERSSFVPDIPTIAEVVGAPPEENDFGVWGGIFVPAATPQDVVSALNGEINRVLETAEVRDKITSLDFQVLVKSPSETAEYVAAENAKYERICKELGLSIN